MKNTNKKSNRTVAFLPNGMKVILTNQSDARNVKLFSDAIDRQIKQIIK